MASNRKRTPEVIDLLSSDDDATLQPPTPKKKTKSSQDEFNSQSTLKASSSNDNSNPSLQILQDEFNSQSTLKASSSNGNSNPSLKILLTDGKARHGLEIESTTSLSTLQNKACNLFGFAACILKYGVPPFLPLDDISHLQHRDKIRVEEAPAVGTKPAAGARKNNSSSSSNEHQKKPAAKRRKQNEGPSLKVARSTKSSSRNGNNNDESGMTCRVATYNVWFGHGGDGAPYPEERMFALTQALLANNTPESPLYFVGFQELTPRLVSTLKPAMEAAGYKLISQDLSVNPYGCGLAVLQTSGLKTLSYGWQPYRSTIMGRGFLYLRAQLPKSNKQVLFTTTHLESFVGNAGGGAPYTGVPEREEQVRELATFCQNQMSRFPDVVIAMISGDLNWDDERVQSKGNDKNLVAEVLTTDWKDTWFDVRDRRRREVADRNGKVKKKDEPTCYTYDAKDSQMLGGSLRRRFDRILLSRQNDGVKIHIEDTELIGRSPIEGLTWKKQSQWNGRVTTKEVRVLPSDHFGYVVTLTATGRGLT